MKQVLIMALVTLFAPSLQLNGMLMTWKLYQAKQDYANRGALLRRIHYAFIPVTGLNYSYFQPVLSYTSKIFMKDLEVRRDPETRPAWLTGLILKVTLGNQPYFGELSQLTAT